MDKFILKLDRSRCIGCGACASICPNVFTVAEDGKSTIKEGKPSSELDVVEKPVEGEDLECAKNAAQACPVEAIRVLTEGGEEIAPKTA